MAQPKVLILRAPGTNCDAETAYAFERAGGHAEIVHVRRALESPQLLAAAQILCLPGGFSYGDDIASGRIFGVQLQHHLAEAMRSFTDAGKLVLGICNGFQVLAKCGLLAADDAAHGPPVTLAWNNSGKFEDRWINLAVQESRCVFLTGVQHMYLPVAHGEGRFVARDAATLAKLEAAGQLPLRYAALVKNTSGAEAASELGGALQYPDNPNGAQANVAGMCDATGRIFGLMPHPERHIDATHHPRWTRRPPAELAANPPGEGLRLFQNAVNFFR